MECIHERKRSNKSWRQSVRIALCILPVIVGGSTDNNRKTLWGKFCDYCGNNNIYTMDNTEYKDK